MFRVLTGTFGPACERCMHRAASNKAKRAVKCQALVPYQGALPLSRPPIHSLLSYSTLSRPSGFVNPRRFFIFGGLVRTPVRHAGTVGRIAGTLGRFLKVRYLVLTSAIGGGVSLHKTYESWRESIPDLGWLNEYIPDREHLDDLHMRIKTFTKDWELPDIKLPKKKDWTEDLPSLEAVAEWLDAALESAEVPEAGTSVTIRAVPLSVFTPKSSSAETKGPKGRLEEMQDELMTVQVRYQKEIDRLEKDNRELRRQLLLKKQKGGRPRKMKRSLIDMYSEVLDDLADYDSSYNTQDHLPRVVVVGDQSSGKTSVLEMIAQARIFPRGSGEMMTRAPVKVTLSEGPYHVATFKDSTREFDLTKESELEALRREVEIRMKASVAKGKTVSSDTISLSVKGPGLQRMVLVDLPGIISTVTSGMAVDTKEQIRGMLQSHMSNPNAIILCIQDGSLDAERSNVTDLVSSMDPTGKRTIFVLTKVDLAETSLLNPDRIKKILEGKLFPMKALGYFAVVTGKGNNNDSIGEIKDYEEMFFRKSQLFRDGVLKPTQMTTKNLSFAVSECFWKMVKGAVEQQADAFKATRFNLETEWKNTFPRVRELDRDELFEKARGEILDELINLSLVTPQQWEDSFSGALWDKTSDYVFEHIYLPASQTENVGTFNTTVDIRLKQWADKQLPNKCVEIGRQTLEVQFSNMLDRDKTKKDRDEIFDKLKLAVKEESMSKHTWDEKAEDSLRVIQVNTLEDRSVHDKYQWDAAVKFMEVTVKDKLAKTDETMKELVGPGLQEQWMYWKSKSQLQKNRGNTIHELDKLLQGSKVNQKRKPVLSFEEITTVRKNLEAQGIEVENEFIRESWYHLYRRHFLQRALQTCGECKKGFYYYQQGFTDTGMDCSDVVLFWRIQRMLQVTSNALRQQVMNNEARRLERNIKSVLDDFGDDKEKLTKLLTGRRVQLAEELKQVRNIQERLEDFINQLNKDT